MDILLFLQEIVKRLPRKFPSGSDPNPISRRLNGQLIAGDNAVDLLFGRFYTINMSISVAGRFESLSDWRDLW